MGLLSSKQFQFDTNHPTYRKLVQTAEHGHLHDLMRLRLNENINFNLVPQGSDISLADSLFFAACANGKFEIASYLLHHGANVNGTYSKNDLSTPLLVATEKGHYDIVKLIVSKQAQLNHQNQNGSALHIAASNRFAYAAKLFCESGAALNETVRHDGDLTPLHLAAINGHSDVARILLEYGANMNACTKQGMTAMQLAMAKGHNDIIQLLCQNGYSSP